VKGLRKTYRTAEEIEEWKARDAIELLEARGVAEGVVSAEQLAEVWDEIRAEVTEAVSFAHSSPLPDPKDFDLNVYSN